jgi:hypothetical protein
MAAPEVRALAAAQTFLLERVPEVLELLDKAATVARDLLSSKTQKVNFRLTTIQAEVAVVNLPWGQMLDFQMVEMVVQEQLPQSRDRL